MKIELEPGDRLEISLKDTDGGFVVDYACELTGHLRVLAEFPDSQGRGGVVYDEDFTQSPDDLVDSDAFTASLLAHPLAASLELDQLRILSEPGPVRIRFKQNLLNLMLNPPKGFMFFANTILVSKDEHGELIEVRPGLVRRADVTSLPGPVEGSSK